MNCRSTRDLHKTCFALELEIRHDLETLKVDLMFFYLMSIRLFWLEFEVNHVFKTDLGHFTLSDI